MTLWMIATCGRKKGRLGESEESKGSYGCSSVVVVKLCSLLIVNFGL